MKTTPVGWPVSDAENKSFMNRKRAVVVEKLGQKQLGMGIKC